MHPASSNASKAFLRLEEAQPAPAEAPPPSSVAAGSLGASVTRPDANAPCSRVRRRTPASLGRDGGDERIPMLGAERRVPASPACAGPRRAAAGVAMAGVTAGGIDAQDRDWRSLRSGAVSDRRGLPDQRTKGRVRRSGAGRAAGGPASTGWPWSWSGRHGRRLPRRRRRHRSSRCGRGRGVARS